MKPDPLGFPRHPLVIYLFVLCTASGALTMLGYFTAGGVEAALPEFIARGWGLALFVGGLLDLLGAFWQGDVRTGLAMKRLGSFILMLSATVYSVIIMGHFDLAGMWAAGVVFGFAIAAFCHFRFVNKRIHEIIALTEVRKMQGHSGHDSR